MWIWSADTRRHIYAQPAATPAVSVRSIIFENNQQWLCYSPDKATIRILMYHYIREESRDPVWSVVANNSISPALFEQHSNFIKDTIDRGETTLMFMSELERAIEKWCFPNNDITILSFDDWRRDNYGKMLPILRKYNLKATLWVIYDKISQIERIDPFMNLSEARQMLQSGIIEFQSHSYSHPDLTTLNYAEQYKEICTSKPEIEQLFGININTFIYPMWKSNLSANNLVRDCGYTFGLSTRHGTVTVNEIMNDPRRLQRIRISKWTDLNEIFWR